MRLSILLKALISIPAQADREISRLVLDSRRIQAGDLFFAIRGASSDGRQYINDALAKGAVAVLVEAERAGEITYQNGIPLIPIQDLKSQIGVLASCFYDHPAKKLRMTGVTGTNGKTSITHFIAQGLGEPCGVIGTLGSGLYGSLGEAGLTTPDAISLHDMLHHFVQQGVKTVAMEVSSHSIDQGRVNGIEFEMGIFTNLTQDHLDYHGTMEAYAAVKRRFLAELPTQHVIINGDDSYGQRWIEELAHHKSVFAYATQPVEVRVPRVYADKIQTSLQGIKAKVHSPWGEGELVIPLIGRFNLSNVLAVLTVLCFYGIPFEEVLRRLSRLKPTPGRMQTITGPGMPLVVVDYSHTPDSLEKALEALRAHATGKLFCVFGCGGNRDAGKRPIMAKIAERLADRVIVTNDNPRHEKPEDIAQQIMRGFSRPELISVVLDRSKAIENSIQWANANDCILIAGKGAEHYQQVGDEKIHFDDVEEADKCIAEKMNVTVVK